MKKLKSQSGRSMVEMLGVLAIIGVLSVGGIAGYSLSMRRHRANGIVDLVSKYALVLYNDCQKKLIDGEITTEPKACSPEISFENAGVGVLPSGVGFGSIITYISETEDSFDRVNIQIEFSDAKLCQAVGSVAGSSCYDGYAGKQVFLSIKQN